MIQADFLKSGGKLQGFSIRGHAGYAEYGQDVACASVSSAVQLTVNGITEVLGAKAEVLVEENKITCRLEGEPSDGAEAFLKAFLLHLQLLREEFPQALRVNLSEVH